MTSFNGFPIVYGYIGESGGRKVAARAITDINGNKKILVDRQALTEKWNEKAWKNPLRSDFIGIIDFESENDLITWILLHELGHHKFNDNAFVGVNQNFRENRANSYATQNFISIRPQYAITSIREQFAPDTLKEDLKVEGSWQLIMPLLKE